MRWIRLLKPLFSSKFKSKLTINETSSLKFSVWPTDVDVSIMNHAAMMSVFEAGRIDYMVRTGFFKLARQQKWYFPNSSISIQFFRPMKVFQKAVLTTRVFHMEEHFIFIEQKIRRQGKDIAFCIVKSKVKSGRVNVSTQEIVKLLNAEIMPAGSKELVELYERHEDAFKHEFLQKE
ncbi:MAG TPA: acyl-CoA thioesterase [Ferruginibacter sp.]|nr:acyl-CoA thioesterase [Ferruginibacter sp.]